MTLFDPQGIREGEQFHEVEFMNLCGGDDWGFFEQESWDDLIKKYKEVLGYDGILFCIGRDEYLVDLSGDFIYRRRFK